MPIERKIIYFDGFAGASGDMLVGSLVDLGADFDRIRRQLGELPLSGYEISKRTVSRGGISATKIDVEIGEEHPHRTLTTIEGIIKKSPLPKETVELSVRIFRTLATAESKIHGIDMEEVVLHEVGSVDAIIDIVGCCLALAQLEPDEILCSPLPLGGGTVKASHGLLPVPAPATVEILKGVPLLQGERKEEMVTPTGAAILKTVVNEFGPLPLVRIERIGYGAGERNPQGFPNVLRSFEGWRNEEEIGSRRSLSVIETNIDDTSPQVYGFLTEQALSKGALDVFLTPVYMKKGRPATLVTILCSEDKVEEMLELLYRETETIGCRVNKVERYALPREIKEIETSLGKVRVKVSYLRGKSTHLSPEYEDCRKISQRTGMPLRKVMDKVKEEASKNLLPAGSE